MRAQNDASREEVPGSPSLLLELAVPVLLLVSVGTATLIATGSVKIVEAFLLANTYLILVLSLRGRFATRLTLVM